MIASKQIAENYVETGRKNGGTSGVSYADTRLFRRNVHRAGRRGASVASAAMTNASASRIASALVFPAGLALVVCTGAELFTGNCLMTISALQKRISVGGLFKKSSVCLSGKSDWRDLCDGFICLRAYLPSLYGGDLAQVLLNTAVSQR